MSELITPKQANEVLQSIFVGVSDNTRRAYQADLRDACLYFRIKDPAELVRRLLSLGYSEAQRAILGYRKSMISAKRRDLAPSTVNRRLTVIRLVFRNARRRGIIQWQIDVRGATQETVKDPDGPSPEIAAQMLAQAAADDSPNGRRTYLILRLALDLGLRRSSIIALDYRDVDWRKKRLRVALKGRDKPKWKELPDPTIKAIRRWIEVHPLRSSIGPTTPLIVNLIKGRHTRISGPAIYQIVRAISSCIGHPTRPHGLRHTAIEMAVRNTQKLGATLDQVQAFSDHKDFRMVLRYRNKDMKIQGDFAKANASSFGDPATS